VEIETCLKANQNYFDPEKTWMVSFIGVNTDDAPESLAPISAASNANYAKHHDAFVELETENGLDNWNCV
jgi:hypothetical protein